jgi:hypothetical protein
MVIFLAKSPLVDEYDLSSVTRAGSEAAPLAKDIQNDFSKRLKLPEMTQGK